MTGNISGRSITIAAGVFLLAFCRSVSGQVVTESFDNLLVSENFDSSGSYWTTLADAENLFIIQDGEYILQRKAQNAPYAIISGLKETQTPFRIMTSLKFDKSYGEQSFAGVMFMMQPQAQGGFLIEFNSERKYRIRQIVSGAYRYLTGDQKEGGWTKNSAIRETGTYNTIEVRASGGNYDIYFNGRFIQTCVEKSYRSGSSGLIIGPATRAKADFYYIFGPGEVVQAGNQGENPDVPPSTGDPDIITLTESIIVLKTEINSLKEENDGLKKMISAMRSGDAEQQVTVKNYEKQVKNLEGEIKKQQATVDSLQKANNELLKYKEMVGSNESGDLVITLSKALKAEKEKNATLEKELKLMKEQKNPPKSAPPKSQDQNPSPAPKKEPNQGTITLPAE